jgi:hypothetical protein
MWTLASLALAGALLGGNRAEVRDVPLGVTDPVTLFRTVCLADQVKLSKRSFAPVSYAKLPAGVKMVLGYSIPPKPTPPLVILAPMPKSEVPNSILALLPKKNAYLLLPAPGRAGRVAAQCAVIWRGNHFVEALAAAKAIPSLEKLPTALWSTHGRPGANSISVQSEGMIVGAAEFNNWTVIRIGPDITPQEQIIQ